MYISFAILVLVKMTEVNQLTFSLFCGYDQGLTSYCVFIVLTIIYSISIFH